MRHRNAHWIEPKNCSSGELSKQRVVEFAMRCKKPNFLVNLGPSSLRNCDFISGKEGSENNGSFRQRRTSPAGTMVGGHSSFSNSKIQSLLNRGTLNLLIRKHGNQTEQKCTAKTSYCCRKPTPK